MHASHSVSCSFFANYYFLNCWTFCITCTGMLSRVNTWGKRLIRYQCCVYAVILLSRVNTWGKRLIRYQWCVYAVILVLVLWSSLLISLLWWLGVLSSVIIISQFFDRVLEFKVNVYIFITIFHFIHWWCALLAITDVSAAPKHVSAEDLELFRQACNITRQVT